MSYLDKSLKMLQELEQLVKDKNAESATVSEFALAAVHEALAAAIKIASPNGTTRASRDEIASDIVLSIIWLEEVYRRFTASRGNGTLSDQDNHFTQAKDRLVKHSGWINTEVKNLSSSDINVDVVPNMTSNGLIN